MNRAILIGALALAACSGTTHPTPNDIGGNFDTSAAITTTAGTTSGSGAAELTGDLAFPVEGASSERGVTGRLTVLLFDQPLDSACTPFTFADELQVTVFFDGGATVGTFVIDDGGAEVVLSHANAVVAPVARAVSGVVTLNRLDTDSSSITPTAGGNFLAQMQPVDGGPTSQLSALFGAPYCD